MSALRESASFGFGRFLSESLEWDTMGHVLPAPTATILHDQSLQQPGSIKMYRTISRCRPQRSELTLPPPIVVMHALPILEQALVVVRACLLPGPQQILKELHCI